MVPSASTIRDHFEPERGERVQERAEAGGPPAATVSQPASCHFIQQICRVCIFAGAGAYFHPRICVCATFSWVANATAAACG